MGQLCFDDQEGQWRKWTPHVAAIIQSLQTEADPARSFIVVLMYVAEGIKFSTNPDNLSPVWLQTFKRIEKSLFWKLLVKSR